MNFGRRCCLASSCRHGNCYEFVMSCSSNARDSRLRVVGRVRVGLKTAFFLRIQEAEGYKGFQNKYSLRIERIGLHKF